MDIPDTFLDKDDMRKLTGFAHRLPQIAALKRMGIPFFVNGRGWAIVARAAIEGRIPAAAATSEPKTPWVPRVLKVA